MKGFAIRTTAGVGRLIIVALMVLSPAAAKKMYKYQDEAGKWHFSDIPPKTEHAVETQQLQVTERQYKVTVSSRGIRTEPDLYIVNDYFGPAEVEVALIQSRNFTSQPELPARFTVPAAREIRAVKLRPARAGETWSYRYRYRVVPGDPQARHRPLKPYRPPFEAGASFVISQAFHGSFSHNDPQSEYAVDIAMPEGSKVYAARAGIVMDVANDFDRGGTDSKYVSRANLIRILHDDGTMAVYGHLRLETAQVTSGIRVTEGQWIAESGSTGFSSGPHLHFAVQKNAGMDLVSIPFEFEDGAGKGITPTEGMMLTVRR